MQKKVNKPAGDGESTAGGQEKLKKKFEEIKKIKTHPEQRLVTLRRHCTGSSFTRMVPWDSPLTNNTVVSDHDVTKGDSDFNTYGQYYQGD